jgi:hypothetical protein
MTQNVWNEFGGIVQRYRLGPASVMMVATAPPGKPLSPVISCSTYRPSRVHTSSVSNTKLLNASSPNPTANCIGMPHRCMKFPIPRA